MGLWYLVAKSMQNLKKCASGLPTIISEYIQPTILDADLSDCGNFQFDRYKILHRLTKMSLARFLLLDLNSDMKRAAKWRQIVDAEIFFLAGSLFFEARFARKLLLSGFLS
jgi:hypothetical protein